jgi:hypothetical protein
MNSYTVTNKLTGEKVYEYRSDFPIEWGGMEFSAFDHTEAPVPPSTEASPTMFGGERHITKLQFRKLLLPHEEVKMDKIRAKFESMDFTEDQKDIIRVVNNKYQEATYIDLDDDANRQGLIFFASIGALDSMARVGEILNG